MLDILDFKYLDIWYYGVWDCVLWYYDANPMYGNKQFSWSLTKEEWKSGVFVASPIIDEQDVHLWFPSFYARYSP